MKRIRFVLAIVALALGVSGTAMAQESPTAVPEVTTLEHVTAYVQPSVVYLNITAKGWVYDTFNKTYLNDGDPFVLQFSCTGFFVNSDGYIATAGHCVDKKNFTPDFFDVAATWVKDTHYYQGNFSYATIRGFADDDYRLEGEKKGASGASYTPGADVAVEAVWDTESTEPLYDKYGDLNAVAHEARIVKMRPWNDGQGDTAILKIDATDLPSLPLASDGETTTGTDVVSIGYPASVGAVSDATLSNPSFKEGSISSVRTNGVFPVYEMSASLSGGMSGGPTVNYAGEVVGVNSYSINGEVSEFNFVQSSETLRGVMEDAGVPVDIGEISTQYRAGLDALFAENKAEAVENLEAVVAIDSDFEMAQEFLVQAEALPNPPPPPADSNLLVPIGIALAVLIIGAGGAFFVLKKKKGSVPVGPPSPKRSRG